MTCVETMHTVEQLSFRHMRHSLDSPRSVNKTDLRSLPLSQRLSLLPAALAQRAGPAGTLAVCQVWTSCQDRGWAGVVKAPTSAVVFRTMPVGAHLSDAALAPFRASSSEHGITRSAVGLLGKVWSSGALAVVQQVCIIPASVHPRNKLNDTMVERVSEIAYIPVYDLRQPDAGVVACLEVMMSAFATSALVANVISHTCDLLTQFQLSLGKPSSSAAPALSPFASATLQAPRTSAAPQAAFANAPPTLDHASAPLVVPPAARAGSLPPLRAVRAVPGHVMRTSSGCSSGPASPHGSAGSSSSGPSSPGTPVLAGPPPLIARSMSSMRRSSSIRRLDSVCDMQH